MEFSTNIFSITLKSIRNKYSEYFLLLFIEMKYVNILIKIV